MLFAKMHLMRQHHLQKLMHTMLVIFRWICLEIVNIPVLNDFVDFNDIQIIQNHTIFSCETFDIYEVIAKQLLFYVNKICLCGGQCYFGKTLERCLKYNVVTMRHLTELNRI